MTGAEREKRAVQARARRESGLDPRRPSSTLGQRAASEDMDRVMRLPLRVASPVQVTDPDDPDFGKFYFMTDYDPI